MHIMRDNRDDAEIQKADQEPLFLWNFLRRFHKEKKAGTITQGFWEGLREALPQFETPATFPPVPRPTAPPQTRPRAKIPPSPKVPLAPKMPPARPRVKMLPATPPSSVGWPSSPPPILPKPEFRWPRPMKKAMKRSGKERMKVEDEEEEEEDEEEKEEVVVKKGEEEEKEEEEDEGEEEKKEEEVGEIRGKAEDNGWEGEEEIEVDTPVL